MRILQIVAKRQHRGAEVFASILAADLTARSHEVAYLGIHAPPPEPLAIDGALNADISSLNPVVIAFRLWRFILRFWTHDICSDLPVFRELIAPGVNGLLAPAGDVQAWTQQMGWLAAHPHSCHAMGVQARASGVARFDIRAIAVRYQALYREVALGRNQRQRA